MTRKISARRIAGNLYEFRDGASVVQLTRRQLEAEARAMGAAQVCVNQSAAHGVGEDDQVVLVIADS